VRGLLRARGSGLILILGAAALLSGGCGLARDTGREPAGGSVAGVAAAAHPGHGSENHRPISARDRSKAQLATAAFQDVGAAEAAGWQSSLQTLGCFEDPRRGGMGVHYINEALMDGTVDIGKPEALVYELGADRRVTGLVAHEYIVPVDAWHKAAPPRLFGVAFHRHPSLPLFVLHAWLWKANARGDFDDWNPSVRLCPSGVPVFGEDRVLPQG
jgi:hypothetical protein